MSFKYSTAFSSTKLTNLSQVQLAELKTQSSCKSKVLTCDTAKATDRIIQRTNQNEVAYVP